MEIDGHRTLLSLAPRLKMPLRQTARQPEPGERRGSTRAARKNAGLFSHRLIKQNNGIVD